MRCGSTAFVNMISLVITIRSHTVHCSYLALTPLANIAMLRVVMVAQR
eukprot:COSAG02_NODE_742_length_17794_cov_22.222718_2_plen_48_part_00